MRDMEALSTHHIYWPRNQYQTPVERIFRNLPENKVELPWGEHQELHATTEPPEKPSHDEMCRAIGNTAMHLSVSKRKALGI